MLLNEGSVREDKSVLPTVRCAITNFRKEIQYCNRKTVFLEIPYEDGLKLPGYLYLREASKQIPSHNIPTLLNCGRGDPTQEVIHFVNPVFGPVVAYAVITFEGPGQVIVLRRDKLPMRPGWKKVTGLILDLLFDYAAEHPELELDLEHIAVTGAPMDGFFALRAATYSRIKACVSTNGFYSLVSFVAGRMPGLLFIGFMHSWLSDSVFNTILRFAETRLPSSLEFQSLEMSHWLYD